MKKVFKATIVCQSCGGTGLYSGMSERKGCAVICNDCDGTGREQFEFEYEVFKKRKGRKDIKRVFKDSCGYGSCPNDYTTKEGRVIHYSKGGCTYQEWVKGVKPLPVEDLYCPMSWESQHIQNDDNKHYKTLYSPRCSPSLSCGCISDCKLFSDKAKCWEIYWAREGRGK